MNKQSIKPCTDVLKTHKFIIVKNSGKKDGTPLWLCAYCQTIVKSS